MTKVGCNKKEGEKLHKILIVEDDEIIAGAVKKHIETWGLEVQCVKDYSNVLKEFINYAPELVIMDIYLPFFNGYHWCSEIRKVSKVPIIFISSASDNMNIIMAVNMGADDFISKPFDLAVLTAKVQAVLRRTYDFVGTSNLTEHKGAIFNFNDGSVNYKNEKLELSKNDSKILHTLLENKGKIISRDTLMTRLWETDSFVDENTLTVNVTRLRKKLESIGLNEFIITKKGMGYLIE